MSTGDTGEDTALETQRGRGGGKKKKTGGVGVKRKQYTMVNKG